MSAAALLIALGKFLLCAVGLVLLYLLLLAAFLRWIPDDIADEACSDESDPDEEARLRANLSHHYGGWM